MSRKEAVEEYAKALKEGQKEYKECLQKETNPNPIVLDEILEAETGEVCVNLGLEYSHWPDCRNQDRRTCNGIYTQFSSLDGAGYRICCKLDQFVRSPFVRCGYPFSY